MNKYENWDLEIEDRIATLALNRPEQSNNLTVETFEELGQIADRLSREKGIWVVVLEARGRHFSIGVDVGLIGQIPDIEDDEFRRRLAGMQAQLDAFEALELPTIAKLHGFCLGGGLILALCCDFRLASERTVFGFPEVKRGIPVLMGTQRVSRIAGLAKTKELLYLAETFNAAAALGYGLVHRVLPADKLDSEVELFTEKFLRLPPRTVGRVKRILHQGSELTLKESQELEIETQIGLKDSPDFQEAIQSFLESREPEFRGE
jgi:enoyl-CoA hydratase/carnithine racemase